MDDAPPLSELIERLHFNLQEGLIWLDDRRVLMLGAEWLADLRRELIQSMGTDHARGVMTRLGYGAGCRDAQMALRLHGSKGLREVILTGVQFHALQGSTSVTPITYDVDVEAGRCFLEFEWRNSVEDQIHTEYEGQAGDVACWMEIGYSSGFLTTCIGRPIVVREVACTAAGAPVCRCEARPSEEWGNSEEDLRYFQPPLLATTGQRVAANGIANTASPAIRKNEPMTLDATPSLVIGRSASFNTVLHRLQRVAQTNATVLLLGESGVGKSAFARELHQRSRRADKPFLEINCAAIPEALIEAELFGVERGAYTGAQASRAGRFEQANTGAIFLDEIGTLSLTAQSKILRVIQNQEFERLGSAQTRKVDVRIIAATNEDLEQAVHAGRFRLDLFFRLNVVPLKIPPLRERRDDLPILLEHFLRRYCERHFTSVPGFTARALRALLNHDWPGNIRELENVIERGVILADHGAALDIQHLFTVDMTFAQQGLLSLKGDGDLGQAPAYADSVDVGHDSTAPGWAESLLLQTGHGGLFDLENQLVIAAMEHSDGNVAKAARILKITRAQMDYRVKRLA